jgi:hypothetical protein
LHPSEDCRHQVVRVPDERRYRRSEIAPPKWVSFALQKKLKFMNQREFCEFMERAMGIEPMSDCG